jgi:hypothetical protein
VRFRSVVGLVLAAVVGVVGAGVVPADAQLPSRWAPEGQAAIHPGVMVFTAGNQCTANFIYTDGTDTYIGVAAHCAAADGSMDTNGCRAASVPLGTEVHVAGARRTARLAYSSWLTMQANHEHDRNACAYNDFALVRLDPADAARTNPTVPHWGGPNGLKKDTAPSLSTLYGYGNSMLRLGIGLLAPKSGMSLGTRGGGWTHPAYMVTPGIPGDSGGAMLDANGLGGGVLSTVTLWPLVLSNNYTDLNRAMWYMWQHGGPHAALALGTRHFNGAQLPLG